MGRNKIAGRLKKFSLIIHTVKHLKLIQVFYQIYYRIKRRKSFGSYLPPEDISFHKLQFDNQIHSKQIILGKNHFQFLNLEKQFDEKMDWKFQDLGKLWYYNLQYFDYLFQDNVTDDEKLYYLKDLTGWLINDKLPLESYPVSLRVVNGIRYFSNKTENKEMIHALYAQTDFLYHNPEYQILGNHLLENAFTLFMGGYAFDNEKWRKKGKTLLCRELKEQILPDGAHFELSPMYHKIILFRVLELIDWYGKTKNTEADFLEFIQTKATNMLNWLYTVSFYENEIPYFNDSADHITYTNQELFEFAGQLNLPIPAKIKLQESGYRKFEKNNYQCVVDVGQIGASYQPGHAHADALSFIFYLDKVPFVVETGTSTYRIGAIRNQERSTQAHNTVVINGQDQSEVWAGFRVGNRANVRIEKDANDCITASQDGYKRKYGIIHQRNFVFAENQITIVDTLLNSSKEAPGKAYLHFHPDRTVGISNNCIDVDNKMKITFNGKIKVSLIDYHFAMGFNACKIGKAAEISFSNQLTTIFDLD